MDTNDIKQISEVVNNLTDIAKQPIQNLINKPTQSIGEGLSNIFNLVFAPFKAANIYTEIKLNKFKTELESNINQIPEDKKVQPPLNIVGPVLEAAKFHIDDDEIRSMFAKLIASSMNVDTHNTVHPALVEIIKQLRPLDAQIFASLSSKGDDYVVANISIKKRADYSQLQFKNIVNNFIPLDIFNTTAPQLVEASIDNLLRLQLISVHYDRQIADESLYELIEQHPIYKLIKSQYEDTYIVSYTGGIVEFTAFGHDFAKTCL